MKTSISASGPWVYLSFGMVVALRHHNGSASSSRNLPPLATGRTSWSDLSRCSTNTARGHLQRFSSFEVYPMPITLVQRLNGNLVAKRGQETTTINRANSNDSNVTYIIIGTIFLCSLDCNVPFGLACNKDCNSIWRGKSELVVLFFRKAIPVEH